MILTYTVYFITAWFLLWNMYYLLSEQISIWHMLLVMGVSYLNTFCLKNIIRCWEMQISEAAEYYIDILAMNGLVSVFDFWTHKIWYAFPHYVGTFIGSFQHLYFSMLGSGFGLISLRSMKRLKKLQKMARRERRKKRRRKLSMSSTDFLLCSF